MDSNQPARPGNSHFCALQPKSPEVAGVRPKIPEVAEVGGREKPTKIQRGVRKVAPTPFPVPETHKISHLKKCMGWVGFRYFHFWGPKMAYFSGAQTLLVWGRKNKHHLRILKHLC